MKIPKRIKSAYRQVMRKKPPHPEPLVKHCIDRIIAESIPDIFVDIGANSGQVYVLPYAKRFVQVFAVEPNPYMVEILKRRLKRRFNVIVSQLAISDREDKMTFFKEEGITAGASTLEKDRVHVMTDFGMKYSETEVSTMTLDNFYGLRGGRRLTLLLIDVEGHEFKVLAGGQRTLERTENIIVELHHPMMKEHLENLLRNAGFNANWIDSTHILGSKKL